MREVRYNRFVKPHVIEGFVGPMMSGKTSKLLRRIDPLRWMGGKYSYIGFKPKIDSRKVTSRSTKDFIDWIYLNDPNDIFQYYSGEDIVAIDEAQFFFDKSIIGAVLELQKKGANVIYAGLDKDFRGEPFGQMKELMFYSNELEKCKAICTICGDDAYYTQRLIDGKPAHYNSPIVLIEGSGKEEYTARCYRHFEVPGKK